MRANAPAYVTIIAVAEGAKGPPEFNSSTIALHGQHRSVSLPTKLAEKSLWSGTGCNPNDGNAITLFLRSDYSYSLHFIDSSSAHVKSVNVNRESYTFTLGSHRSQSSN